MSEHRQGSLIAGRYRLAELLGGTDTEVYRGHDELLGRAVAIKLARPDAPGYHPERFAGEARLLAGLRHPGLVPLFDVGADGDRPYLVMQYVSGPTLAARIRSWPPGEPEIRRIAVAVAGTLAHLHANGVVHRDVKPGNLLLGDRGQVYLADLGIARDADTANLTDTGLVIGTPAYLAPEQVAGQPVGPACDLYSLGLVLLECFTGRREYAGTPVEAAVARLGRSPVIPDTLPEPWPELLAALTARDPAARPTAQELVTRLTAPAPATAPATGPATVPVGLRPGARGLAGRLVGLGPGAAPRRLGRRRWARVGTATAAVAAGVATVLAAWSAPGAAPPPASVVEPTSTGVPQKLPPARPKPAPTAVTVVTAAARQAVEQAERRDPGRGEDRRGPDRDGPGHGPKPKPGTKPGPKHGHGPRG